MKLKLIEFKNLLHHKASELYAAVFDYFLRSVQSTKGSWCMVNVVISIVVDMACCSCSCFYSPLFHDKILQSWTKILWHNFICGAFSIHTCPAPPSPHKQRWTPVSRIFSEYTTALSQGLLSRIVGSTLVCEKRRGDEHPRRPRGNQSGRGKRRDESFQAQAEKPLGTDSHRTISKRSSECCLLIGHKKCFVLLCPIGEQFLPSSFREFIHDCYYLATVARFVHQAFLTWNEGTTDKSKNVSDAINRSNSICTEKILFLTDHNVS